jgi:hypothetical protein
MNEKLDVGTVLQRVVDVYRSQAGLLIPAALIVFIPVAVLNGLIATGGGVLAALVAAALGVVGTYWFQGMVVEATEDILDGRRDHTLGSLFASVTPVLLPLIGAGILAGIGIAIGFILIIVPGLFLLTIWAVVAPAIVAERKGVFDSFGRSRELVKGHGWQVFGVIVVLFLLQLVVGGIIQAIFRSASDTFASFAIADLVVRVLIAPLSALAAAVMFFELKRLHGEPVPAPGGAAAPAPAAGVPTSPPPPAGTPGAPPPPPSEAPTVPEGQQPEPPQPPPAPGG